LHDVPGATGTSLGGQGARVLENSAPPQDALALFMDSGGHPGVSRYRGWPSANLPARAGEGMGARGKLYQLHGTRAKWGSSVIEVPGAGAAHARNTFPKRCSSAWRAAAHRRRLTTDRQEQRVRVADGLDVSIPVKRGNRIVKCKARRRLCCSAAPRRPNRM